jgi:hypothetical protein
MSDAVELIILLGGFTLFGCIIGFLTTMGERKLNKAAKKFESEPGFIKKAVLPHISGLPIEKDKLCSILLFSDKFVFFRNEMTYTLPFDRISDISQMNHSELRDTFTKSVAGAAIGGLLLGPLGAVLGAGNSATVTAIYLVFSYKNEQAEEGFLVFNASNKIIAPNEFIKAFKNRAQGS